VNTSNEFEPFSETISAEPVGSNDTCAGLEAVGLRL
jgi:hypothetical protein